MDDDHYSEENKNARAAEKRREDMYDFHSELGDRENGKQRRFVMDTELNRHKEKHKREKAFYSLLNAMMSDPAYAAAYNETMTTLGNAETTVYDALIESAEDVADAQKALEKAQERGASAEELERLREQHKEAKERHERMLERERELADIRARMEDKDNPPAKPEMGGYKIRISEIESATTNDQSLDQSVDEVKPSEDSNLELDLSGLILVPV